MSRDGAPAVFFDRDGTLNNLTWIPEYGEWGPPRTPDEMSLRSGATRLLSQVRELGFLTFVVTNQPDVAKGKNTLKNILGVRDRFLGLLEDQRVTVDGYRHCLHHEQGLVPELAIACTCRKPRTGMIDELAQEFEVNLADSWMVGDRVGDIECGKAAGLSTIGITSTASWPAAIATPDYLVEDLDSIAALLRHSR